MKKIDRLLKRRKKQLKGVGTSEKEEGVKEEKVSVSKTE